MFFFVVLSVSWASLVPPAAGIPLRYAAGTVSRAVGAANDRKPRKRDKERD